jgi:hypothetical protein
MQRPPAAPQRPEHTSHLSLLDFLTIRRGFGGDFCGPGLPLPALLRFFLWGDVAKSHLAPMNIVASEIDWRAGHPLSPNRRDGFPSLNEKEEKMNRAGIRPYGSEIPCQMCHDGNSPSGSISPCRRLTTIRTGSGVIPLVTQ